MTTPTFLLRTWRFSSLSQFEVALYPFDGAGEQVEPRVSAASVSASRAPRGSSIAAATGCRPASPGRFVVTMARNVVSIGRVGSGKKLATPASALLAPA
jgi:hypothetical protein